MPLATKLETVGEFEAQKVCAALPVGADVVLIETVTSSLEVLSHELTV